MPGLLLPNGSYHDSSAHVETPEQAVPGDEALEDAHEALADETAEPTEETTPAITPCVTAFTVYLLEDGGVVVGHDAWGTNAPQPSRPPTFDEITFGASVLRWHVQDYAYRVVADITEDCVTAFTPYYTHDGRWLISASPEDPLVIDREPTDDELLGGCSVVLRDVANQEVLGPIFNQFGQSLVTAITQNVTQSVIGNMINMGKQAASAKDALEVAEKLERDKQRRAGGR